MVQTNSAASCSNTLDVRLLVAKIPLIDEFDAYCLDFKCHMSDLFESDKVASNFALELETPRESKAEEDEFKTRFKNSWRCWSWNALAMSMNGLQPR